MKDYSEVFSMNEAAEELGLSKQAISGFIRSGCLSSKKIGNILVIPKQDVAALKEWYESNKETLAPVADDTWKLVALYEDGRNSGK